MGNKWTTTVNCSSRLHALRLIQSQRETFFFGTAELRWLLTVVAGFLFSRGNVCTRGTLERREPANVFQYFDRVACCEHLLARLPPTSGPAGHEKRWLNPFSVPTPLLRVKAGRLKKKGTFVSPSVRRTKGVGIGESTHTQTHTQHLQLRA